MKLQHPRFRLQAAGRRSRRLSRLLGGRRGGFTLIELVVVIGIIALLAGILVPVLASVVRQRNRTSVTAVLSSISTALDAYQQDFGDYPRFEPNNTDPLNADLNTPAPDDVPPDRGARLLARALFGPAPADPAGTPPAPIAGDPRYLFMDGHGDVANPFGFKERRQTVTRGNQPAVQFVGELREPYLDAERFDLRKSTDAALMSFGYVYGPDAVLLDPVNEQPILYYPARAKSPDLADATLVTGTDGPLVSKPFPNQRVQSLYNANDNIGLLEDIDLRTSTDPPHQDRFYFRELVGDLNQNGVVDQYDATGGYVPSGGTAEAPVVAKYLLIAVGESGNYYQLPVTNFTRTVPDRFPDN